MFFNIEEFADSYQYPVLGFEQRRIVWSNACARIVMGQYLNSLDSLFSANDIEDLQNALKECKKWRAEAVISGGTVVAELIISENRGYIVIRPKDRFSSGLLDQMLSDAGQLMKEPLNNLHSAIRDLDNPQKKEFAIGVIKHSFYSLVRLSENQIALTGANSPEAHINMKFVPIAQFVQDIIAAVNETLGDIGITIELNGMNDIRFCKVHPQKLTQIIMLLISNSARGLEPGSVICVNLNFDNRACYIEIPVLGDAVSIYDTSSYLSAAGTPLSPSSMENLMLTKIFTVFNDIHNSRIFKNINKNGQDSIIIAIDTEIHSAVEESETTSPGLRPDLIFLSDILDSKSYM